MNRIDTTKWKEFKIHEIFYTELVGKKLQTPTGANIKKTELTDGNTPRITVSGVNNGVIGYFDADCNNANYRVYENFISVSFLGTVFYQEGKASLDMKVHCLKLKKGDMNKYIGHYLVTCIRKSLKKSRYSDQISSTVLPLLPVRLPVDKTGNPDFLYMEEYMKKLENQIKNNLKLLNMV
ncbi:MAG: restriction endonuclease subunit S [Bacteroides sp.]|nr:restriction endonuclease subunit S [Bacteroides sp.]